MSLIPFKALKMGARSLFSDKVTYGKSRVSGSHNLSYIMCSKAGVMPGQKRIFTSNYLQKPGLGTPLKSNIYISSFRRNQNDYVRSPNGNNYTFTLNDEFTYDQYYPYDDEAFKITILASYRQIYGNFNPMESEKPVELERRLRNGDITVKEFIRGLCKSIFYKTNFVEKVNQQRAIELAFKNVLGRPPMEQKEIIKSVEILYRYGFEYYIDSLIDSEEYNMFFGEHIVPYLRVWDSPNGAKTSSFIYIAKMTSGFAISDNAINRKALDSSLGGSILLRDLAK